MCQVIHVMQYTLSPQRNIAIYEAENAINIHENIPKCIFHVTSNI